MARGRRTPAASSGIRASFAFVFILVMSWVWVAGAGLALGAQRAKVLRNSYIYETPDHTSRVLEERELGAEVDISSSSMTDPHGRFWYKILTRDGRFGYIAANDVMTQSHMRLEAAAGLQAFEQSGRQAPKVWYWNFSFQMHGLVAYRSDSKATQPGGDFELAYNLLPRAEGYARRQFALGPALQLMGASTVPALSFVYRIYSPTRGEPEARIRVGRDLGLSQLYWGFSLGYRYPFATFAGYQISLGAAGGLGLAGSQQRLYGTAGIAFHF